MLKLLGSIRNFLGRRRSVESFLLFSVWSFLLKTTKRRVYTSAGDVFCSLLVVVCLFLALNNHQSICCSCRDSCYGVGNWRWIIIVLYQLLVADEEEEEEEEELILCLLVRFFLSSLPRSSSVTFGFRHCHCGCWSFLHRPPQFCQLRLSSSSLRMLKLLGSSSSVLDRLQSKHWILLLLCLTT